MLTYIMACTCGSEEECGPEDQLAGAMMAMPSMWHCYRCHLHKAWQKGLGEVRPL